MKCSSFFDDDKLPRIHLIYKVLLFLPLLWGIIQCSVYLSKDLREQKVFHDTFCLVKNITWKDGSKSVNYTVEVDGVIATVIKEGGFYHPGSSFRCWFDVTTKNIRMTGFKSSIISSAIGIAVFSTILIGFLIFFGIKTYQKYQKKRISLSSQLRSSQPGSSQPGLSGSQLFSNQI